MFCSSAIAEHGIEEDYVCFVPISAQRYLAGIFSDCRMMDQVQRSA